MDVRNLSKDPSKKSYNQAGDSRKACHRRRRKGWFSTEARGPEGFWRSPGVNVSFHFYICPSYPPCKWMFSGVFGANLTNESKLHRPWKLGCFKTFEPYLPSIRTVTDQPNSPFFGRASQIQEPNWLDKVLCSVVNSMINDKYWPVPWTRFVSRFMTSPP